jgi:hypothetical protein
LATPPNDLRIWVGFLTQTRAYQKPAGGVSPKLKNPLRPR